MHWTSGVYEESLPFVGMILSEMTNHPPLSSIVKSRHLSFFGHLVRMDENADDSQVIFESPPESWRRPPGCPHATWMKISLWTWSCMKPENWLRIDLSGDSCLCLALRTRSGAYCWIGA